MMSIINYFATLVIPIITAIVFTYIYCMFGVLQYVQERLPDSSLACRGVGSYFIVVRPFQKKESMKNIEYS